MLTCTRQRPRKEAGPGFFNPRVFLPPTVSELWQLSNHTRLVEDSGWMWSQFNIKCLSCRLNALLFFVNDSETVSDWTYFPISGLMFSIFSAPGSVSLVIWKWKKRFKNTQCKGKILKIKNMRLQNSNLKTWKKYWKNIVHFKIE